jgi:hypothetical protein
LDLEQCSCSLVSPATSCTPLEEAQELLESRIGTSVFNP